MTEQPAPALFNIVDDIGETRDVSAAHPDVLARLQGYAARARADLGDSLTGRAAGAK